LGHTNRWRRPPPNLIVDATEIANVLCKGLPQSAQTPPPSISHHSESRQFLIFFLSKSRFVLLPTIIRVSPFFSIDLTTPCVPSPLARDRSPRASGPGGIGIIGGGVIAVEYATVLASVGVGVTVFAPTEQFMPALSVPSPLSDVSSAR